ncbi:hypothetical protein L2E82_44070 [Cichorium intybus]|uniref:Uncharacterized protein n=1 Tax=Cichorium intybus TaxID=13427 RepID=A0ACB8ZQ92_CICIN|nr:hypothetical protein L2E82_44070 [Cichorium intybus]
MNDVSITIISQIKRPVSNFTCHLCDFSPSFHISQKQHVGKLSPEFLSLPLFAVSSYHLGFHQPVGRIVGAL